MNIVFIMTDTQPTHMVGCYSGNPRVGTPHIDKLAAEGVRFDRAYTTCPLCTPARSAIFSGMHPQVNGAWANSMAPGTNFPLMGTIFAEAGYAVGYSGKWHLDGTAYFGDGEAGGGFPQNWWFDGKNYADFLGSEKFKAYRKSKNSTELEAAGFTEEHIWGHQVANRALDFLEQQRGKDRPFLFVASFDEPHNPYVTPPGEWERYDRDQIPLRENFQAPLINKPALQQQQGSEVESISPEQLRQSLQKHYACNQYVDREIGRIVDFVDQHFAEDTLIIYTTDHGDMQRSHGLRGKGPIMYDEVVRVPFIVRHPKGVSGVACDELVSHVDIIPTLLELSGQSIPEILHGHSFAEQLFDPEKPGQDAVLINHTRFAINHDGWGGFYPVRCLVNKEHKLVINMLDTDELYAEADSSHETINRIEDIDYASKRDTLHDRLLEELSRIRDPFRAAEWAYLATGGLTGLLPQRLASPSSKCFSVSSTLSGCRRFLVEAGSVDGLDKKKGSSGEVP